MKRLILEFDDTNMAGSEWSWEFYLTLCRTGALVLSARQIVVDGEAARIAPVQGLRDGVDVYTALCAMVEEAGYSLDERELPRIAGEIAELDAGVASQFADGPALAGERDEIERKNAAGA